MLAALVLALAVFDGVVAWLADQTTSPWVSAVLALIGGSYLAWGLSAMGVGWAAGTVVRGAVAGCLTLVIATGVYYAAIVVFRSRDVGIDSLGRAALLYLVVAVPAGIACGVLGNRLRVARGGRATALGAACVGLLLADSALTLAGYTLDPYSPRDLANYPWETTLPVLVVAVIGVALRRRVNTALAFASGVPLAVAVGFCLWFVRSAVL